MSSSVRSRIVYLLEHLAEQVVAEEEQGQRTGDEDHADDRDRRAGDHLGHLALAGPPDEDHSEDAQQDWCDLGTEERDDLVGIDFRWVVRGCQLVTSHGEHVRGMGRVDPYGLAEL